MITTEALGTADSASEHTSAAQRIVRRELCARRSSLLRDLLADDDEEHALT
jgi:hypothetical protein